MIDVASAGMLVPTDQSEVVVKEFGKFIDYYTHPEKWKTQKAIGMTVLPALGGQYITHHAVLNKSFLTEWPNDPVFPLEFVGPNLFARPCPVRPRHGFVESRGVKTWDEVRKLLQETLKADPDGELMLTTKVNAAYSYVWTPTMLSAGLSNDGATAGKDVVSFPLSGGGQLPTSVLAAAHIKSNEDPYVEGVINADFIHYLTQLRAGPKLTQASLDFIPFPFKVGNVYKVQPDDLDLLAWEDTVKDLEGYNLDNPTDMWVVWHPGGSPTDHISVHARSVGVPLMITREPKPGEWIEPDKDTQALEYDLKQVLAGLVVGDRLKLESHLYNPAATLLLMSLHNSHLLAGEFGRWLGVGVALTLRLGSMALRGEARHLLKGRNSQSREAAYELFSGKSLKFHARSLNHQVNIFRYGNWGGSFGGPKWAGCGIALSKLFAATEQFVKAPSQKTVQALIRALNITINQAHNGGWWFNKFISPEAFTMIPAGKLTYITRAASIMVEAGKIFREIGLETLLNEAQALRRLSAIVRPPKAEAFYYPHAGVIGVLFKQRAIPGLPLEKLRLLTMPVETIFPPTTKFEGHIPVGLKPNPALADPTKIPPLKVVSVEGRIGVKLGSEVVWEEDGSIYEKSALPIPKDPAPLTKSQQVANFIAKQPAGKVPMIKKALNQ